MSPRFFPALAAAVGLFLTGCFATSKNPLSSPATSMIDPSLEGVFVARQDKKDEDLSVVHFHYRREKSATGSATHTTPWLEILNIEHDKEGGLRGAAYRALTVRLGGHEYMSIVEVGSVSANGNSPASLPGGVKAKSTVYQLLRYEVGVLGELRVWFADTTALQRAIEAGKLQGQVTHHNPVAGTFNTDSVQITDSTEHLAAFVAGSDPRVLFGGKPTVFYRLTR